MTPHYKTNIVIEVTEETLPILTHSLVYFYLCGLKKLEDKQPYFKLLDQIIEGLKSANV